MSDDPDMETNFVMVGPSARRNSSVDMEGYSLLPDIIWTPGPEMLNSQYGKVIFTNVKESYSSNEDLLCMYSIMSGVEVRDDDRVAIFCVGWANVDEVITWVLAAKHPWPNEELSVVFPACQLPVPGNHFYQFCYLSAGEVRGASVPFNFVNKANVNAEDQQKGLYMRNPALIGTSAQVNIVSTGEGCLPTVAAGHPQNLTLPPSECRNNVTRPGPSSDEPLRSNPAESDASCSEVTSSGQYASNSQNDKQKNMNGIPSKSMYKDRDSTAVASTSQGVNGAEIAVQPCLCIPSGSKDSGDTENDDAESTEMNNDLEKKIMEIEREKQMLLSTMNAVSEENARLRARLNCEMDKNQALTENLRRTEAEVERQMHQYDISRQNNSVVVTELENELGNQRMRIGELYNIISDKERTIAYFSQRFGAVNEQAIALGAHPQFPPYPGHIDGQLQQEGHVVGASSGTQRQDIRSTSPFYAALRKTRNYYVTFHSDKADIERKLFALSCTKLSLVKKLHDMKDRKESLMRLEYQYYTTLQEMRGVQNAETRRILEAISEVTAEQRALDQKAFMEVDMLDEIKNRLEINRRNANTLRAKAIEVFSKFLETYNYNAEHCSGAAQAEVSHIHSLYARLDTRFNSILCAISNCVNNTYVWV